MSISLKDVVKPTLGFQGALQGAGTPNQTGIGGFSPLSVGENSVFFADVQANVNFADYYNYSSIVATNLMEPQSAPHHGLVIACLTVTVVGCTGCTLVMTAGR